MSEVKETPSQRIVKSAQYYFDHYHETHKFDDDDCEEDFSNIYEQYYGCNGLHVKNSSGVTLAKLRIIRHELDEDIYEYELELTYKSPHAIVEHSQPTLDQCCLDIDTLPKAIEKVFKEFENIKLCTQCNGINKTVVHDICDKCNIKELLGVQQITCTICLEETRNYINLPCGHNFHINCFGEIKNTYFPSLNNCCRKCPLCRALIQIEVADHNVNINLLTLPTYESRRMHVVDVTCAELYHENSETSNTEIINHENIQ
jgi:hypothetical protein